MFRWIIISQQKTCVFILLPAAKNAKYQIHCHVNVIDESITVHVLFTYFYIAVETSI